jgi:pilus assembly protein Flp/PilA
MFGLKRLRTFLGDRRGATVVEYALIASIISIGVVGMATTLGSNSNSTFNKVAAKMG